MAKLYDFGADYRNVSANERRAFAWPVAVWTCYIPESDVQDINILEHLILQLVNNGINNPKAILCSQIGFNKDLVDAAIESCRNEGYFDKRTKELRLSNDGKSMVAKYDNPYLSDLEASKKNRKIYMIQDMVTKSVIPVFDITKLPDYYLEDPGALEVKYENNYGKKPKSAAIRTAMRYWAKLCNNLRRGEETGSNTIDCSEVTVDTAQMDGYIPFEDEIDWETIQEDGSVEEDVKTLAEKEAEDKQKHDLEQITNLTILDDSPEYYSARGFIAINKNAPDELIIVSPFGKRLDDWFRTVINRMRACNKDFEDEIQLFLMEKKEELKDSIAFGNNLDIALFDKYPYICNDSEYKAVKRTIELLTKSKYRFENGEDESAEFAQNMRKAYEASLRLLVKHNKHLYECQKLEFWEYNQKLKTLVKSYSFLSDDILREYKYVYNNMLKCNDDDGNAPGYMAMILIDAWENKNGVSMELLRSLPLLPLSIKEYTSNLNAYKGAKRKGAGNIASHGGDELADLEFTLAEVEKQYSEFEGNFIALYNRYMEAV
ncbi:hypothetical protein [Butyrivibrio sp. VCB2006]|uniref:hypothetical protein n=1 Tax=Butyrivibrio sp. VCB2006 TaxID=1280679 RepID=UPI00041A5295|nr:hypothetical protein [Butyrivibrio sp. VCB2006]